MNMNAGLAKDIVAEARKQGLTNRQIAYVLATADHETGGRMMPVVENLNYSVSGLLNTFGRHRISTGQAQAFGRIDGKRAAMQKEIANVVYGGTWGAANLGNTKEGDGFLFRGRGLVQITGRRNHAKFSDVLGVDLVANPDLALDPKYAVQILVIGMAQGLFTGKRLSDFINGATTDYRGARAIINGSDRAADIAALAVEYEADLAKSEPARPARPAAGFWEGIMNAIARLFGRT